MGFKETVMRWVGLGMPDNFDPAAAEGKPDPSASSTPAKPAADSALITEMKQQIADQNAAVLRMQEENAKAQAKSQYTADCAEIASFERRMVITPAEGASWRKLAQESPAAFAAARETLEKRQPLPNLVGFGAINAESVRATMENGSSAGHKLVSMAQERAKEKKIEFAVALAEVSRENSQLAREHLDSAPSYVSGGSN